MTHHLLSILIWLPIVGGFITMLLGDSQRDLARWLALAIATVTFVLEIVGAAAMGFPPSWPNVDAACAYWACPEEADG